MRALLAAVYHWSPAVIDDIDHADLAHWEACAEAAVPKSGGRR